ncbi:MAG: hypothetical protein WCR49_10225 [Opitutae bacterium]
MNRTIQSLRIQQAVAALLVIFFVAGCVSVPPPLKRDKDYPADWPDLSLVGPKCVEINGPYANEGMVTVPGGAPQRITLAAILPYRDMRLKYGQRENFEKAKAITLQVLPKKSSGILEFTIEKDGRKLSGRTDCYFGNGALMYIAESGGGSLLLAFAASQTNVWLTKAVDGSLIAKIENSSAGMILIVPFASSGSRWARFPPAKE